MITYYFTPIYLLPYVTGWDLAKSLLLSVPAGEARKQARWLNYFGMDFTITIENLRELSTSNRDDLAALLLEAVAPADLLQAVAQGDHPQEWYLAVAAHPQAPTQAALTAYGKIASRSAKGEAAKLIAKRLRVPSETISQAYQLAQVLLYGSTKELPSALKRVRQWDQSLLGTAGTQLAALVLNRGEKIPATIWKELLEWRCTDGAPDSAGLLEALATHPQATQGDLLRLLTCEAAMDEVAIVLSELIKRDCVPENEQLYAIWASIDELEQDRFARSVHTSETAHRMLEVGGVLAAAAITSGHLPPDVSATETRRMVDLAYSGRTRIWDARLFELLSQSTDEKLLNEVITRCESEHDDTPLPALARNPLLPERMQARLGTHRSPVPERLLANPGVDPRVAEDIALSESRYARDRWRALLRNPQADKQLKTQLPASVLVEAIRVEDLELVGGCLDAVASELGNSLERFEEFLQLLDEWHGSAGDLARAVTAL